MKSIQKEIVGRLKLVIFSFFISSHLMAQVQPDILGLVANDGSFNVMAMLEGESALQLSDKLGRDATMNSNQRFAVHLIGNLNTGTIVEVESGGFGINNKVIEAFTFRVPHYLAARSQGDEVRMEQVGNYYRPEGSGLEDVSEILKSDLLYRNLELDSISRSKIANLIMDPQQSIFNLSSQLKLTGFYWIPEQNLFIRIEEPISLRYDHVADKETWGKNLFMTSWTIAGAPSEGTILFQRNGRKNFNTQDFFTDGNIDSSIKAFRISQRGEDDKYLISYKTLDPMNNSKQPANLGHLGHISEVLFGEELKGTIDGNVLLVTKIRQNGKTKTVVSANQIRQVLPSEVHARFFPREALRLGSTLLRNSGTVWGENWKSWIGRATKANSSPIGKFNCRFAVKK
jgi:hypothetical protein